MIECTRQEWALHYDPLTKSVNYRGGPITACNVTQEQWQALLEHMEIKLYSDGVLYSNA